jgi:hypothetical protein
MSQRSMTVHRKTVKGLRKELYGQFLDEAREGPFLFRLSLAWFILKGQGRKKKAKA